MNLPILRCAVLGALLSGAPSTFAAVNHLANGDFSVWQDGHPDAWQGWNPAIMSRADGPGQLAAVRMVNPSTEGAVYLQQEAPLAADAAVVRVSAWMRTENLTLGPEGWHEARVALRFLDAEGRQVGGYPSMPRLRADSGWVQQEVVLDKPAGASRLQLHPGLWLTAGTLDLADLRIEGYASRRALLTAGLPRFEAGADLLADRDAWALLEPEALSLEREDGGAVWRLAPAKRDSWAGGTRLFAVDDAWTRLSMSLRVQADAFVPGPETAPTKPMRWRQAGAHVAFLDVDGKEIGDGFGVFAGPHMDPFKRTPEWHDLTAEGGVPPGAVRMRVAAGLFNGGGHSALSSLSLTPSTEVVRHDAVLPAGRSLNWGTEAVETVSETRARIALDGLWRFVPAEGPTAETPAGWGYIQVPGDWQKDGDIVARGDSREWLMYKGSDTTCAWYEREFALPVDWKDRAVELELDRVSTDAQIFVDGRSAGTVGWPGGSVDLTAHVKPGATHVLRLRVLAVKDRDLVPVYMGYAQDEMKAAKLDRKGLIGSVRLLSRPQGLHVASLLVRTSTREHTLAVDAEIANVADGARISVSAEALDEQGRVEKTFSEQPATVADGQATVRWSWEDPRLWDVGQPNRYALRVSVSAEGGGDVFVQPFGFREFWIEGRKFFLNNTEIRLRPCNLDYGAMPASQLARGYNFGNNWPSDLTARGANVDYDDRLIAEADRVGFLVSGKAPHMGEYAKKSREWREDPSLKDEYQRMVDAHIRRWRNHPSVVMWAHTANGFQNQVDGTPWLLGMKNFSVVQEYVNIVANADEAIAMIKSVDPTRPVYAHFGTYAGDVYTSNLYLNFLPLQEREEWLAEWARNGEMPFMAVEMGLPLYSSLMRGRSGYSHQGHSEPFLSEWAAAYLGAEVYGWEPEAYRRTVAARFRKGNLQHEYDPHHRHAHFDRVISESRAFTELLDLFIVNTWRSWRTLGVTGGMVPWHHDGHPALDRVNRDTLAWIAHAGGAPSPNGADEDVFTAKLHHYRVDETLRKQAVLINDGRAPAEYRLTWTATLDGEVLAEGSDAGELAVAETLFRPIDVPLAGLPDGFTGRRGELLLQASIAGVDHEDRFAFDVFAPLPPLDPDPTRTVLALDPEGATTRWLEAHGWRVLPWSAIHTLAEVEPAFAVIGRHALDRGQVPPENVEAFIAGGGRLLVMGQDSAWLFHALHLRTAPYLTRRVFRIGAEHPVVEGLDDENLRDWNGSSTLAEAYPEHPGFEWVPAQGWRWGNRGSVATSPVEKPHRSSWRPVLECEFDLAYTPLMELDHGKGRVTLCTLDLEGRTLADPAADRLSRQLLRYVAEAPVSPKARQVVYLGDEDGAARLRAQGVRFETAASLPDDAEVLLLGRGSDLSDARLRTWVEQGGRAVVLRLETDAAPLGVRLERRDGFVGSTEVPRFAEAAGLSPGDLRWRNAGEAWLVAGGPDGLEVGAGGQLARLVIGRGVVVYAQLGPESVPADEKRYFRFTRWRQTRALSQVLANVGAAFEQDARFLALLQAPDHYVHLAGTWQAWPVTPLPESPWREWHAFREPSDAALVLARADTAPEGGQTVPVPAYLESYGPGWRFIDGEFVFRREIEWPAHAAGKPLFWSLGRVDENEVSFFNGVEVGRSRHWLLPRGHFVSAEAVRAGRNVLSVRVWDEGIHGGMCGSPSHLYVTVAGDDPGFYHPDYISDEVSRGTEEKDWEARAEQWKIADNPYRYYRW